MSDLNQNDVFVSPEGPQKDDSEQNRQAGWTAPGQPFPQAGAGYNAPGARGPYYNNAGNAHQYSYQSGWQQAPRGQPPQPYHWDFEDYDSPGGYGRRARPKRGIGVIVFSSVFVAVLAVAVVAFAGRSVLSMIYANTPESPGIGASDAILDAPSQAPGLTLNDKPEVLAEVDASGRLTTPAVIRKALPSVVGIVQYQANLNFEPAAQGSGIVISSDGYIITNAHVIQKADGIKVVLNNGEEYEARVVGADVRTDLAVIKIEANNLTFAELGNSDQIEMGESVIAIGNPSGLSLAGSVTQGIVSGLDRAVKSAGSAYTINCIQTDAAINPGNSGGALVNQFGQVIGINSAKIAANDYEGIGFAIPINDAKPIIDDLIKNGRVTGRVKIGITDLREIDEVLASMNGLPTGIYIYATDPASDLSQKGVTPGDVITKINGISIKSVDEIMDILKNFKPGDSITLTIYRRTPSMKSQTFDVVIRLMEDA